MDLNIKPPNVLTREIAIYIKPNMKSLANKFNLTLFRVIF